MSEPMISALPGEVRVERAFAKMLDRGRVVALWPMAHPLRVDPLAQGLPGDQPLGVLAMRLAQRV